MVAKLREISLFRDIPEDQLEPLADACRFLEREAPGLLATRQLGRRGLPPWLAGTRTEVRREPLGVVLVIGAYNYPLLLPGVQALQAVVAGNAVLLKPGRDGTAPARELTRLMVEAGFPEGLVAVLDESPATAERAMQAGVDKVLLTGSLSTGRAVLDRLATTATPAILELSGCDAVFVREDADLDLTARALRFGLTFNAGATCIAPRRVFVHESVAAELEQRLVESLRSRPAMFVAEPVRTHLGALADDALDAGARLAHGAVTERAVTGPLVLADARADMAALSADIFAPLLSLVAVADDNAALAAASECPYALGAVVFGREEGARNLAGRIDAGTVVINDMIVPTADPRLPFAGRHASGYGVTRGAEGLLELTRTKAVALRRGRFRPHFDPVDETTEAAFVAYLEAAHGRGLAARLAAAGRLLGALVRGGKDPRAAKRAFSDEPSTDPGATGITGTGT